MIKDHDCTYFFTSLLMISAFFLSSCAAMLNIFDISNRVKDLSTKAEQYAAEAKALNQGECNRALQLIYLLTQDKYEYDTLLKQASDKAKIIADAYFTAEKNRNAINNEYRSAKQNWEHAQERPNIAPTGGGLDYAILQACDCECEDEYHNGTIDAIVTSTCRDSGRGSHMPRLGSFTCDSLLKMYEDWLAKRTQAKNRYDAVKSQYDAADAQFQKAKQDYEEQYPICEDINKKRNILYNALNEVTDIARQLGCSEDAIEQAKGTMPPDPLNPEQYNQDIYGSQDPSGSSGSGYTPPAGPDAYTPPSE